MHERPSDCVKLFMKYFNSLVFSVDELNINQTFHGVFTANNKKSVVKEGTLWLLFKILQVLY